MKIQPHFGSERALTCKDFTDSCVAVANGVEVQPYFDVFYDSVYFIIERDDIRRALLEACIACDIAVLFESIRAGQQHGKPELAVRNALSDRDLLVNLRVGLPKLFGAQADFSTVQTSDYELVKQLWAARGSIAHGLSPAVGTHGRAKLPSRENAADMMLAAYRLIGWLQQLPNPA